MTIKHMADQAASNPTKCPKHISCQSVTVMQRRAVSPCPGASLLRHKYYWKNLLRDYVHTIYIIRMKYQHVVSDAHYGLSDIHCDHTKNLDSFHFLTWFVQDKIANTVFCKNNNELKQQLSYYPSFIGLHTYVPLRIHKLLSHPGCGILAPQSLHTNTICVSTSVCNLTT